MPATFADSSDRLSEVSELLFESSSVESGAGFADAAWVPELAGAVWVPALLFEADPALEITGSVVEPPLPGLTGAGPAIANETRPIRPAKIMNVRKLPSLIC